MLIKTRVLSGSALDYAVARALDLRITINNGEAVNVTKHGEIWSHCRFSKDWSITGPYIQQIGVCSGVYPDGDYYAQITDGNSTSAFYSKESLLTAICRAIVNKKLGSSVEIPDEITEYKD